MHKRWTTLFLLCSAAPAALCHSPKQAALELRLATDLTSYASPAGSEFQSFVIAPFDVDGRVVLPLGTIVRGTVREAKSIGIGLVRERAGLDLSFREYQLPDGRRFPFTAILRSVDNARESVDHQGHIRGILATSSPQAFLHGIWRWPTPSLVQRSLIGLTGASGRIWTQFSMGPAGAAGLFALRCALFPMAEPEIHLPPGTELKAEITSLPEDAPSFDVPQPVLVPEPLASWLRAQSFAVTKPNGERASDVINVVFVGSRARLIDAFRVNGWYVSDRLSARAISRAYNAYASQAGYAAAPVSKLLYEGVEPEIVFEKSLNTLAKRHHVRVWHSAFEGQDVWLAAATHDVAIAFKSSSVNFTHRIDRRIDVERRKVVNDLAFSACSDPAGFIERPAVARAEDDGKGVFTDGRMAVLLLHACKEEVARASDPPPGPGSKLTRIVRRMLLESRHYLLRGSAYYWAYRAIRWTCSEKSEARAGYAQ